MPTIPVKWFDRDTAPINAPILAGQPGALIALLDAVLVNGYNVRAVQSITVSNGEGVVEFGTSGHGYVRLQVVRIEGATDASYNGEWRVQAVASTSITLDMTGVADGSESGNSSLGCRVAPLGWEKAFSDTNKAAYRSLAPDATGIYLRVDDTTNNYARVRGYETMTDVDTGTGMFPTTTQRAESGWAKSAAADATARPWTIIGDDRFFYLVVHSGHDNINSYPDNRVGVAFGDFITFKYGDLYNAVLFSCFGNGVFDMQREDRGNILHRMRDYGTSSRAHIARAHTNIGGSMDAYLNGPYGGSDRSGNTPLTYPNPADNGLLLGRGNYLCDSGAMRGELPGYYACMQNRPMTHGAIVEDVIPGRALMMIGVAYNLGSNEYSTRFALDITGPWR